MVQKSHNIKQKLRTIAASNKDGRIVLARPQTDHLTASLQIADKTPCASKGLALEARCNKSATREVHSIFLRALELPVAWNRSKEQSQVASSHQAWHNSSVHFPLHRNSHSTGRCLLVRQVRPGTQRLTSQRSIDRKARVTPVGRRRIWKHLETFDPRIRHLYIQSCRQARSASSRNFLVAVRLLGVFSSHVRPPGFLQCLHRLLHAHLDDN